MKKSPQGSSKERLIPIFNQEGELRMVDQETAKEEKLKLASESREKRLLELLKKKKKLEIDFWSKIRAVEKEINDLTHPSQN